MTFAPAAVEIPDTSSTLPLLTLVRRYQPAPVSSIFQRWLLPPCSAHWMTLPPSASDQSDTSSTLPLCRAVSVYDPSPSASIRHCSLLPTGGTPGHCWTLAPFCVALTPPCTSNAWPLCLATSSYHMPETI